MNRSGRPGEAPPEGTGRSRTHVLFVCAQNRIRSLTAERMLKGSLLYEVRSRGVAKGARVRLSAADIAWAEVIFVMEKDHKDRMTANFGRDGARKKIICLFIEDVYEAMEESLIGELRLRLSPHLTLPDDPA